MRLFMTNRKLNNREERDVALSHLCGVSPEYIRNKWYVAPSTVTRTILGKRSYEWNDPLVEFYRDVAKKENRDKNAMHLYLAFNGEAEGLPNVDLLGIGEPLGVGGNVCEAVERDVFVPRIERLISQDTSLASILTPRGLDAEDKLLISVFGGVASGGYRAEKIVKSLLYEELRNAYNSKDSRISPVFDNVKSSILDTLRRGFNAVENKETKEFIDSKSAGVQSLKERLKGFLSDFTHREEEIIKLRYGIGDAHTLEEVGRKFKITRDRVRQIEEKALRRLQNPVRSKKLQGFLGNESESVPEVAQKDIKKRFISDLGFPIWIQDVLARCDIRTVEDLCNLPESHILSIKYFGESTLAKIQGALRHHNLSLK